MANRQASEPATALSSNVARRRLSVRFFCIALAVLLISSIFTWGFQSDWGTVKIERLTLTGSNGTKVSTLIYIPKTATAKTPAPGIIIFHGRSNQGHSNDTWSMELARRGYVVLSPDLSGGGESDVNDRNPQAVVVAQYANSLDIIKTNQLNLIGYSFGCFTDATVDKAMPDKVNSVLYVFGPFMINMAQPTVGPDFMKNMTCNVGVIKAFADQYDHNYIGDSSASIDAMTKTFGFSSRIVPGTDMKTLKGKLFTYNEISGALHQTGNISTQTINEIIRFETKVATPPVQKTITDQTWVWQQLFSGVAAIDMMFLLAASIGLLLETPFFSSLTNKRPSRQAHRGAKAWIIDILFSFVIPILIFIPVSAYGMEWFNGKILSSNNLNGIMLWLVVIALIGLVRMQIKRSRCIKNGETIALSDYCLAGEGESHLAKGIIWKSILMGVGLTCFFGLLMTAWESYFGIDYQVWNLATYLKPSGIRVLKALPYMLIIFFVMFVGNLNQRTLPSTGNERKDMIIAVAVNAFMTASALFILLIIQYGGSLMNGTGKPVFDVMVFPGLQGGGSTGALDFAFGYCYMMGGTTAVVTYIYRKYGNILMAVIPAAIFCGLFTSISFTLAH